MGTQISCCSEIHPNSVEALEMLMKNYRMSVANSTRKMLLCESTQARSHWCHVFSYLSSPCLHNTRVTLPFKEYILLSSPTSFILLFFCEQELAPLKDQAALWKGRTLTITLTNSKLETEVVRERAHILFLKQETSFKKFCLGGDATTHWLSHHKQDTMHKTFLNHHSFSPRIPNRAGKVNSYASSWGRGDLSTHLSAPILLQLQSQ